MGDHRHDVVERLDAPGHPPGGVDDVFYRVTALLEDGEAPASDVVTATTALRGAVVDRGIGRRCGLPGVG